MGCCTTKKIIPGGAAGGGADNLGNHTASQNLDMSTFAIINVGNVDGRDVSVDGATLDAHLNGLLNKHDATEVDYERLDANKKNIGATSDAVEAALTDLDDAVGALAGAPTNYTPTDATIVADHLAGIDTELGNLSALITAEDIWDRATTTISPKVAGDTLDIADIDSSTVQSLNVKTAGTPATEGYVFDSVDAFATGNWMLGKAAGTTFLTIRPSLFAHTGTANSSFGGRLQVNASASAAAGVGLVVGNFISGTADVQLASGSGTGIFLYNNNVINHDAWSWVLNFSGSEHLAFNLLDDSSMRIQGLLDGSSNRQFARIRTLIAAAITNGAFQIYNETNAPEGNKLLQLLNNNGAFTAFEVDATGTVQHHGGLAPKRTATAVDYQTDNDRIVGVTDTSIARTITLSTADLGRKLEMFIKDESGGAGTNNITITTQVPATNKIDGASSQKILVNYGVLRLYSDGTNWFTL